MRLFVYQIAEESAYCDGMTVVIAAHREQAESLMLEYWTNELEYSHPRFYADEIAAQLDKAPEYPNKWVFKHSFRLAEREYPARVVQAALHDG